MKPKPNPFASMLTAEAVTELKTLGIRFTSINTHRWTEGKVSTGDRDWPMLVLPSGCCLCIASDDEGNGPDAIHEVTAAP